MLRCDHYWSYDVDRGKLVRVCYKCWKIKKYNGIADKHKTERSLKMKFQKAMVSLIVLWLVVVVGCASVGKFTPAGADKTTGVINFAQGLLGALDGFYDQLLSFKILGIPDYTIPATLALTLADQAATMLKEMIARNTATEEEMNTAKAKVEAAQLFLKKMQQGNK
jgi:nitrate/nitrite transporter NarK